MFGLMRLPAAWFQGRQRSLAITAVILAVISAVTFVSVRLAIDTGAGEAVVRAQADSDYLSFSSPGAFGDLVSRAESIVVASVVGEPVVRERTTGSLTVEFEDVVVSVENSLKGTPITELIVSQATGYRVSHEGLPTTSSFDANFTPLEQGRTFVFFLQETGEGRWISLGVPLGFEVDGRDLLTLGQAPLAETVSASDLRLSSLDDLAEQVEALLTAAPE